MHPPPGAATRSAVQVAGGQKWGKGVTVHGTVDTEESESATMAVRMATSLLAGRRTLCRLPPTLSV